MNNALYNPRDQDIHQPYRIPFNMVVYTCIIASIGIIVYLVVKCIIEITIKNTVLQKHNAEINEQIELLKKHTMEMDERIALLHKTDEKTNEQIELLKTIDCINTEKVDLLKTQHKEIDEQIELLKPQITEINVHNNEMSTRYETAIQELSELVGLFVVENEISAKIQTTVSNITKYFEFFDKIYQTIGYNQTYRLLASDFIFHSENDDNKKRLSTSLFGFKFYYEFNPFTHTPILMKYFSKYYSEQHDNFVPLFKKAWGGLYDNSPENYTKSQLSNYPGNNEYNLENFGYHKNVSYGSNHTLNVSPSILLLNRGIIQLLHETDEEFELKILENVLIELEDMYIRYKKYEMVGITKQLKLQI